jgi:hypothetical protein
VTGTKLTSSLLVAATAALAWGGCGDNLEAPPPIVYTDPSGGKLRLIKDPATRRKEVVLDLVVGDAPLTGYSVGFDLPLDTTRVVFAGFTPGTALPAGEPPIAAMGVVPRTGPMKGMLVTGQSQKASGDGAVTTDATLAPGAVLYTIRLDLVDGAPLGVVFDGTAPDFVLPSGGLRDRAGNAVVEPKDVAIGKLEVTL